MFTKTCWIALAIALYTSETATANQNARQVDPKTPLVSKLTSDPSLADVPVPAGATFGSSAVMRYPNGTEVYAAKYGTDTSETAARKADAASSDDDDDDGTDASTSSNDAKAPLVSKLTSDPSLADVPVPASATFGSSAVMRYPNGTEVYAVKYGRD